MSDLKSVSMSKSFHGIQTAGVARCEPMGAVGTGSFFGIIGSPGKKSD